ncbi:MAG: arginine repressor [Lachnospiraceae bacterium]|nr:arginine repressor [Lachnospiraceae bacterium]
MKSNRHAKIIDLITHNIIETQEDLAQRLLDAGYQVTQATISRDIKDLRLMKMPIGDGRQQYVILKPEGENLKEKYTRILRAGFVSTAQAQNIMVIKTVSGMAMAVAAAIDALEWIEVVGCIAGDDTVMCALRSVADYLVVSNKLEKIVTKENG